MTLTIIGIDPGVKDCKAVMIESSPAYGECAYGRRALLKEFWGGDSAKVADGVKLYSRAEMPSLVLIEMARGSIASGRDADPVLRNNLAAGELYGRIAEAGIPVALVASGGNATAWNWRTSLGVKGTGAAAKDRLTVSIVQLLVEGYERLPSGARGGHIQDWWDAAGIACSGLQRVLAFPRMSPVQAVEHVDEIGTIRLAQRKHSKAMGKLRRAAAKEFGL